MKNSIFCESWNAFREQFIYQTNLFYIYNVQVHALYTHHAWLRYKIPHVAIIYIILFIKIHQTYVTAPHFCHHRTILRVYTTCVYKYVQCTHIANVLRLFPFFPFFHGLYVFACINTDKIKTYRSIVPIHFTFTQIYFQYFELEF